MKNTAACFGLLLAVLVASPACATPPGPAVNESVKRECVKYNEQYVTVTGVVLLRSVISEAPEGNWGKKPLTFPMLILDRPICAWGDDQDEEPQFMVWALQLSDCPRDWPSMPTPVRTTGAIIQPSTWHWYTAAGFIVKRGIVGLIPYL